MSKAGFGQLICVLVLIAFIGFSFFGKKDTLKTADEIGVEVTEKISMDGLEKFSNERLSSQFGFDGAGFDSFFYYGSEDVMDVREILIIRDSEKSELEATAEIIEKKAEEKYSTYKDYDPVASSLLEKRVIEISRGAIIYIVHDDAAAGFEAFLKCVEE